MVRSGLSLHSRATIANRIGSPKAAIRSYQTTPLSEYHACFSAGTSHEAARISDSIRKRRNLAVERAGSNLDRDAARGHRESAAA